MERILVFDTFNVSRALDCLREHGIRHGTHSTEIFHGSGDRGASVIWIYDNAETEPAAELLREQGISVVRWPWRSTDAKN